MRGNWQQKKVWSKNKIPNYNNDSSDDEDEKDEDGNDKAINFPPEEAQYGPQGKSNAFHLLSTISYPQLAQKLGNLLVSLQPSASTLNAVNIAGDTPLNIAIRASAYVLATTFVEAGADLNLLDAGKCPTLYAFQLYSW